MPHVKNLSSSSNGATITLGEFSTLEDIHIKQKQNLHQHLWTRNENEKPANIARVLVDRDGTTSSDAISSSSWCGGFIDYIDLLCAATRQFISVAACRATCHCWHRCGPCLGPHGTESRFLRDISITHRPCAPGGVVNPKRFLVFDGEDEERRHARRSLPKRPGAAICSAPASPYGDYRGRQ
ncbi:unnamed protein product, partial [Amoebophrya sp. A120]|eukprot:GSA120T00015066001.1